MERTFSERLKVSLTLKLGDKQHRIAPGNVRAFELELRSWGFEGWVEFLVADNASFGGQQKDEVLADFLKPDLAQVALEVKVVLSDAPAEASITPLKLEGLVSDKSLTELPVSQTLGSSILYRRYGVRFVDAARLLWRQHFPCELYTHKTVQEILEEHKGEHIRLDYGWSEELSASRPQFFVGLNPEQGSSFYDFVLWFVSGRGGALAYDYAGKQYKLSGAKDASGEPLTLRGDEVSALEVLFPEVIRHDVTVLNSWAEGPTSEPVQQSQAVAGVRQDVLLRTPISDEAQARVQREQKRLVARLRELSLTWCRFPLKALMPGALVQLPEHAEWAAAGVPAGDTYRVRQVVLRAEAHQPAPDDEHDAPDAEYELTLGTRLELQDEEWVELPDFLPPPLPRVAEGFIVSEVGEDEDETWHAYTDSSTSLDRYQVRMPLWEDQIITVPFEPGLLPGHFYFPAFKGERVLVTMDLEHSTLKRFLDWRAGARLPADAQGVHLLVGKTGESNTSMKHYYEEGNPLFLLKRTHEQDTVTLKLREGGLMLEVKEEQG
jgi:hypothetical protein